MSEQPPPPPFCPHLTQFQILSLGLKGLVIPVGEADVGGTQENMATLGQKLGKPGRGPLDLTQLGKKLPVYEAQLGALLKRPPKELELEKKQKKPLDNPSYLPDYARIQCQGAQCFFWCPKHETCKEVCFACRAETLERAFAAALTKHMENSYVEEPEGAEGPSQEEETHDHPSPAA